MKLYFSPGACSLSPHIALKEAGIAFDLVPANLQIHTLADGTDFYGINSKGSVPVLELDDGQRLTEGPAIVQYIADQAPDSHLAPANGTLPRYRLQAWLNFITSEIHKGFGTLISSAMPEEAKSTAKARLTDRFAWVDRELRGHQYLMGDTFSVADAYLFTTTNWIKYAGLDISALPNLTAFAARVAARPAVQAAMRAEGLIK
jgi:glutathione S-transferase